MRHAGALYSRPPTPRSDVPRHGQARMHIALDARMLGEHLHGIGRYAWSLTSWLARLAPGDRFTLLARPSSHTHDLVTRHPNVTLVETHSSPFSLREHEELPRLLRQVGPDLFHALSTALPLPLLLPCPFVMTVHDLIPLIFPGCGGLFHQVYYRGYLRLALRAARRVLVDAHAVQSDVEALLGRPRAQVDVVHIGIDQDFFPARRLTAHQGTEELGALADLGVRAPYLLVVGNPRPHKNLGMALETFGRLPADVAGAGTTLHLVLVSPQSAALSALIDVHPARERIVQLTGLSDRTMPALYRHCRAFFCPSLCEGFGLPLAEALASGAVCVSSTATTLAEVLGDGGLGVDAHPGNEAAVVQALHRALGEEALREQLKAAAEIQAARFDWATCASQVLDLYRASL